MTTLPLLPANSADLIVACHQGRQVTRATFLRDVMDLAARLPTGRPFLNLCQDRYLFAVGLFAAVVRGSLSLLPNAVTRENMNALTEREPDLLCLTDQATAPFDLPMLQFAVDPRPAVEMPETPQIPAEQVVACVFTSGSTGIPQPHFKNFGTLVCISEMEAARMWSVTGAPCTVLGTVPFQHMYGLESTVLLPLLGSGVLFDQRPFYPADVAVALAAMPMPRFLVTTPFHLRTLLDAQIELPPITAILSATAPLARELAAEAERRLATPVLEIYGSTETGQIASRQVMRSEAWELFEGVTITQRDGLSYASGGPLPQPQVLGDVLELLDERRFHLLGRGADMINIAGKRNSLAFLNNVILRLPGVKDAVFCLPEEGDASRLAAFVVAPGVTAQAILHGLRDYVDPVFLPRPIVFVENITRNATGKVTAATVQELVATHLRGKA